MLFLKHVPAHCLFQFSGGELGTGNYLLLTDMVQRKSIQGHIARTGIMKGTLERRDHRLRQAICVSFVGVDGHTFSRYTGKSIAKPFTVVWGPRMFALWISSLRSDVGSVWVFKGDSEFPSPVPCHLLKGASPLSKAARLGLTWSLSYFGFLLKH